MTIHNLENMDVSGLLTPQAVAASAGSASFDSLNYIGDALVVISSAAGTGTTPTLDVKVQESADDSVWTDISGATFTQITDASGSTQRLSINADGSKRYLRIYATVGGTTPSFTVSATIAALPESV